MKIHDKIFVIVPFIIFYSLQVLCQGNNKGEILLSPINLSYIDTDCTNCEKPYGKVRDINVKLKEAAEISKSDTGILYTLRISSKAAIGIEVDTKRMILTN